VQQEILAKHPTANLQVYVVWFAMLPGDQLSAWDAELMSDPRVTRLWDEQRVAGRWFAQYIEHAQDVIWDGYLLYGPDATWDRVPWPTLGSSTGTVIGSRESLALQMRPFLEKRP